MPTIVLTGSLMGGYASSLFANFWALSPRFRQEFERSARSAFVDRYGYRLQRSPELTRLCSAKVTHLPIPRC